MCRYFDSFHEYNGCRLKETQAHGQPSFLSFTRAGVEGRDGEEPQHHQIKEKNIMQCEQCIKGPRIKDIRLKEPAMESLLLVGSWYYDHNGAQNDAGGRPAMSRVAPSPVTTPF